MHARRPDHAEHADAPPLNFVGRGDDAAVAQQRVAGFLADKNVDAVGEHAFLQEIKQNLLGFEGVKELFQPLQFAEIRHRQEVVFAADQQVFGGIFAGAGRGFFTEKVARDADRGAHFALHVAPLAAHARQEFGADFPQGARTVIFVEDFGGGAQFRVAVFALGGEDAVLHAAVIGHQNRQHAPLRQAQKFNLANPRAPRRRHRDDAGERGHLRQDFGGARRRAFRIGRVQNALLNLPARALVEFGDGRSHAAAPANAEQAVDEDAVAALGRHAPGRGVRRLHQSVRLQIRHDIANGRRA